MPKPIPQELERRRRWQTAQLIALVSVSAIIAWIYGGDGAILFGGFAGLIAHGMIEEYRERKRIADYVLRR